MTAANIALLVPTRGRPENAVRMLRSARDMSNAPDRLSAWLYIDEDDERSRKAVAKIKGAVQFPVHVACGPRAPLWRLYNVLADAAAKDGATWLWSGGDDIVFASGGWDDTVRQAGGALRDGICCLYGDDGFQHERLCTHPFLSARAHNVLGRYYPPTGEVSLTDIWLHVAFSTIRRLVYLPQVLTDHRHFLRNLAPYDETYAGQFEGNYPRVWAAMRQHADLLGSDIKKLGLACDPPVAFPEGDIRVVVRDSPKETPNGPEGTTGGAKPAGIDA